MSSQAEEQTTDENTVSSQLPDVFISRISSLQFEHFTNTKHPLAIMDMFDIHLVLHLKGNHASLPSKQIVKDESITNHWL